MAVVDQSIRNFVYASFKYKHLHTNTHAHTHTHTQTHAYRRTQVRAFNVTSCSQAKHFWPCMCELFVSFISTDRIVCHLGRRRSFEIFVSYFLQHISLCCSFCRLVQSHSWLMFAVLLSFSLGNLISVCPAQLRRWWPI